MNLRTILLVALLAVLISCSTSNRLELDPKSQDFYEEARLIMTKQEKKIFKHLPDRESREEFIKDFWKKRDPSPYSELNEFKQGFYERVEYANERFREGIPGWKTDRGRIYIIFGFPDKIVEEPWINSPSIKGYLLWIYYRYNFAVEFVDRKGDNTYVINPYSGIHGEFFEAMEKVKVGKAYNSDKIGSKYIDFKLNYDKSKNELNISIPVKGISFVEQDGLLKAEFEFRFNVYADKENAQKNTYTETRRFESTEEELLDKEELSFNFSFDLEPGKYFFDVLVIGEPDIGRTRKTFNIKI